MLFNSLLYIFFFLPIAFFVYFAAAGLRSGRVAILSLVLCSLIFYSYWNIAYLPLILISALMNYFFGCWIQKSPLTKKSKLLLILAIVINLVILAHYKYTYFIISNINQLLHAKLYNAYNIILPLGISFFTFTQITYLVDSYKAKIKEPNFLNYLLFVTFFPHLLAGPIIHHSEMMPQFSDKNNKKINWDNIYTGLCLFSIGLFKKAIIADYFSNFVTQYYNAVPHYALTCWQAWSASLGYSIQIYFDFSGYTDMAIGSALLFNILLPINFNSPYKATSIQDFWRRWHITLSRFLRDYIYIPLGGSRAGELKTNMNVMMVFLLGGLWHGAGWNFIIWGASHGIAYWVHAVWKKLNFSMNRYLAIFVTFLFINVTWVFFRSVTFHDAISVLSSMLAIHGGFGVVDKHLFLSIPLILFCMMTPNSMQWVEAIKMRSNRGWAVALGGVFAVAILGVNILPNTPFIYFQF